MEANFANPLPLRHPTGWRNDERVSLKLAQTSEETMTATAIYLYGEQCQGKGGKIAHDIEPDDNGEVSDDVFLYGDAAETDLIQAALASLARPCQYAPHFRHKCDRAVLEYLGGPEVEPHHGPQGSYWLPVVE